MLACGDVLGGDVEGCGLATHALDIMRLVKDDHVALDQVPVQEN